ncbi:MATE family efflux transporter [Metaclostridioides mangenotii]|jgi:putative MATE family efflux protein|uniref:Multidrug export protein MepA n=1 Tax=Metaclostridioides mangenotii TaxID=1540 RepID=A0ABS4E8X6_9FIRM|nr:MATE family efflux transporter [Clostridioides mangenotii]MBP1854399.1 putative MATE family efflux protein [Clostridioides mangenotii]
MDSNILSNENISLKKKFIRYLGPSVVSMWVFSLYTMVDGIFVSKGVGELALASVNISMPFINFIFAVSLLFSTGASTVIAVLLGKKDIKSANEVFTFNIVFITVLSAIILILAYFNLDSLAMFLGATDSTVDMVKDYLGIVMFFNGFFIVSYSLEVIIKTDGFPILATVGVVISAITNIILDYFFVLEFGWGVKGAAYATGISQVMATAFFLVHFFRKSSTLNFTRFKVDFKAIGKIAAIGFPDSLTELSAGVVILLFNLNIQRYIGESGLIYYSVINYINILVLMTMIGIAQGMQPLSSYYFGANNFKNVKTLFKMGSKSIITASVVVFLACIVFSEPIVSLFIHRSETALFNEAVRVFRIYSVSFLFLGVNVIVSAFFVSVESPLISTIISLGRGLIIVTVSLFTMIFLFGGEGIWYSTIVSEFICMIISLILLKRNYKLISVPVSESK